MKIDLNKQLRHKKQRGLAIVELAMAIPVMILILLVTAEFTRVLYQYNTLTKLVRDGSRYMAVHVLDGAALAGPSNAELQAVKQLVISGKPQGGPALLDGLTEDNVSVSLGYVGNGGAPRQYAYVSADYNYTPIFASIGGGGVLPEIAPLNFTLTALSSMRVQ